MARLVVCSPDGDDSVRIREHLARADLLAPTGEPRPRPEEESVAASRVVAGRGTPLADIVASDQA